MFVHENLSHRVHEFDTTPSRAEGMRKLLYSEQQRGLKIERGFGIRDAITKYHDTSHNAVEDDRPAFWFDEHSFHYFLSVNQQATGTMTATRSIDGELDCQEYYPQELIEAYRDRVFTPCKFAIRPGNHSSFRLMRLMVRETWRDLLTLGCRVSVMNARIGLIPFYRRMGFHLVNDSGFMHPCCGTESRVLVMSADPCQHSYFTDLFETIEDPVSLHELSCFCDIEDFSSESRGSSRGELAQHV